jgi:hypothetical protein
VDKSWHSKYPHLVHPKSKQHLSKVEKWEQLLLWLEYYSRRGRIPTATVCSITATLLGSLVHYCPWRDSERFIIALSLEGFKSTKSINQ